MELEKTKKALLMGLWDVYPDWVASRVSQGDSFGFQTLL
jgi:hypothetical protein